LYVSRFGLTVDRTMAFAMIVWVFGALCLFAWRVLTGNAERFFPALIVMTVVWVTLVNLLNPDALMTRVNIARAEAGAEFDVAHHATLSADALPALVEGAPRLGTATCQALQTAMLEHRQKLISTRETQDWRRTTWPARRADAWYVRGGTLGCR
jgi:hypothetical protein